MDTWILLRNVEYNGERNRTLYVLKSRGMAHSNQVREFVMRDDGIDLIDVYLGTDRVLTGTARMAQEAQERAATASRRQEHERRLRELAVRRKALEAQIAALQLEAEATGAETDFAVAQQESQVESERRDAQTLAQKRGGAARTTVPNALRASARRKP